MSVEKLWSLDRIEDASAVLLDDDGVDCIVSVSVLPAGACEGKMYRRVGESYVEDSDATQRRRERARALQNRLQRRQNGR